MIFLIFYIIGNELLFYTLKEIVTIGATLTGCMLTWAILLCILVARQNKKKGGMK